MTPGRAAARDSIHGLVLGDALGERWFPLMRTPAQAFSQIRDRRTPSDWHWTDDTAMALSVLRALYDHGEIRPDRLARAFAQTYLADRPGATATACTSSCPNSPRTPHRGPHPRHGPHRGPLLTLRLAPDED